MIVKNNGKLSAEISQLNQSEKNYGKMGLSKQSLSAEIAQKWFGFLR